MDVQSYRDHARTLLDLDEEDLTDDLIDRFMSEGFQRIIRSAQRWPFLETTETLAVTEGTQDYTLSTVLKVRGMHGPWGEMEWMEEPVAHQRFWNITTPVPASWPQVWSEWGEGAVKIWPEPDADYSITVYGYREPDRSWVGVAGDEPDLPVRFHEVLLNWVMYRTYLQQDDPEMASMEKRAFDEGLAELSGESMSMPPSMAGLVVGGGGWQRRWGLNTRLPYDDGWE